MTRKSALILALALASLAGTASAGTILDVNTQGDLFSFTDTGTSETATASGGVSFAFQIATVLGPAFHNVQGTISFTGSSTTSATGPDINGNLNEAGWSGSGTITDTDPSTGIYFNQVIFSFSFGSDGTLQVGNGGTSGTLQDNTGGGAGLGEVTLTSSILNFGTPTQQSLSFGLGANNLWELISGQPSPFTAGIGSNNGTTPTSNTASAVLTFDSTPIPTNGMPEPTTLVMMGSALLGLGMFRRAQLARQNANKQ